jgi:hypothetical protein
MNHQTRLSSRGGPQRACSGKIRFRPTRDLYHRQDLTDGVYDFVGNAFGFPRAGAGLFEAGVEPGERLVFRGWRLASGSRLGGSGSLRTLFCGCHVVMVARAGGVDEGSQNPVVAQFEFDAYSFDGVIPKDRVLTSGPRDLRWHNAGEQEILRSA